MVFNLLSILGFIFGVLGFCSAIFAIVELKAMQKSTHKIQWMPVESPKDFQKITDKEWESLDDDGDLFGSEDLNTKL